MAFASVFLLLVAILFGCITVFLNADMQWHRVGITELGDTYNQWFPLPILFAFRLTSALVIWSCAIYMVVDPVGIVLTVENRDGSRRKVPMVGFERLTTFTCWSWILQGIYFALASYASFLTINVNDAQNTSYLPSYFPSIAWVLYEISLPISFLVSLVVTFVLIPTHRRMNIPHDLFFRLEALLMHNLNVVFMAVEFITNGVPIHSSHVIFMILFACTYVVFAWFWYAYKKLFYYFFLDYSRPDTLTWHIGLILGVTMLYMIGYACNALSLQYNPMIPNIAIIAISLVSMTLFDVDTKNPANTK